jgi:hypothetical protein
MRSSQIRQVVPLRWDVAGTRETMMSETDEGRRRLLRLALFALPIAIAGPALTATAARAEDDDEDDDHRRRRRWYRRRYDDDGYRRRWRDDDYYRWRRRRRRDYDDDDD